LSAVEITLVVAALLAGLTGTWSPCGYSMLATIGPTGHCGGQRTTLAACVAFVPGALAGGVITFGALGWLGSLIHGAGDAAYLVAAIIAGLAAVADVRGMPIVPQIRRQLPEHWRRVMPMPLAAGLYGVLLGLGFTTFVLSFGVWALAGISLALGDVWLGTAIGIAFGVGRAVPIVFLAPVFGRPVGQRVTAAMAERPAIYRGFRFGDGLSLAAVAGLLALSGPAASASTAASAAADPGVAGPDLVYQRANRDGYYRHGSDPEVKLNGNDPAIGGSYVAVIKNDNVELLSRAQLAAGDPPALAKVGDFSAPNADAIAVSSSWLVWRVHEDNADKIRARPVSGGSAKLVAAASEPSQLSHPSLYGGTVLYGVSTKRSNKIVQESVSSGRAKSLVSSKSIAVQNPAIYGKKFVYVTIDRKRQRLLLRKRSGGAAKTLYSRKRSSITLNSTALGQHAYVTLLGGGGNPPSSSVLKFSR
jgi:hypothetical protein